MLANDIVKDQIFVSIDLCQSITLNSKVHICIHVEYIIVFFFFNEPSRRVADYINKEKDPDWANNDHVAMTTEET